MGSLSKESFDAFLESLKRAGVAIYNESELRERLAEARRWQYAFATLALAGSSGPAEQAGQASGHGAHDAS